MDEVLLSKNPWWKGKAHFEEDEDYQKWLAKEIRWVPEIVDRLSFKPFSLHFILGPRQSGKTTAIKLIIKKLIEKVDPKSVFYFRCDELADYKELREIIDSYLTLRKDWGIEGSYLFLDEITFPREWFRSIKLLIDEGKFKNDVLVLSGSTTLEIKKEVEYFPGRRGNGEDFVVLPLSFREYLRVIKPELYQKLPKLETLNPEEIKEKVLNSFVLMPELNDLLSDYFKTGGFPLAINTYWSKRSISKGVKQIYLSWIKNDISKIGKSVETGRELMKILLTKLPSAVSWEKISKEASIKSPKTVNSYLHMFANMFVLLISYFIDPSSSVIQFGKRKKFHLLDPLFFQIFEDWCLVRVRERESVIAENTLASHLFRRFGKDVFYWKNRFEIDCVVRKGEELVGLEVKWREKAGGRKAVIGRIKRIYVLSKNTLDLEKKVIPLSIFLALL